MAITLVEKHLEIYRSTEMEHDVYVNGVPIK